MERARHELARHVPHRDRCGAHAPAPVRVDDARDPDRHHRGDPHRRARPRGEGGRPGPDQRARHEHPRRLARQLDRTRSGVRGGFGSSSTLTIARRRRARGGRGRARRASGRRDRDHPGRVDLRRHQLDDHAHRHDAVVAGSPVPEGHERAASSTPPTRSRRGRGRRAGSRHRDASSSRTATRSARTSTTTATTAARSSACSKR